MNVLIFNEQSFNREASAAYKQKKKTKQSQSCCDASEENRIFSNRKKNTTVSFFVGGVYLRSFRFDKNCLHCINFD